MDAGIVTVGDELLAGDVENTNATWLASQLSERGVTVREVAVLPDERAVIAERVRRFAADFDATVVTGGLGATPDDVTVEAVADALGRDLAVDERARTDVAETVAAIREEHPGFEPDVDSEATLPAGSRPLCNPAGISPGCVVAGVYVLPGIPDEMEAVFDLVAGEFDGDRHVETFVSEVPESNAADVLAEAEAEFEDVSIGSYPDPDGGDKRIKVAGEAESVAEARAWLEEQL